MVGNYDYLHEELRRAQRGERPQLRHDETRNITELSIMRARHLRGEDIITGKPKEKKGT